MKELHNGDVVVIDNPSSQKLGGHRGSDRATQCRGPVPPALLTRPEPSSKFKKLPRDGAERTTDRLWALCGTVLDLFTESDV